MAPLAHAETVRAMNWVSQDKAWVLEFTCPNVAERIRGDTCRVNNIRVEIFYANKVVTEDPHTGKPIVTFRRISAEVPLGFRHEITFRVMESDPLRRDTLVAEKTFTFESGQDAYVEDLLCADLDLDTIGKSELYCTAELDPTTTSGMGVIGFLVGGSMSTKSQLIKVATKK